MAARLIRGHGRVGTVGAAAHATPLPRGAPPAGLSGPGRSARGARPVLVLLLLITACTATQTPPQAPNAFAVPDRGARVPFVEYEAEASVYKGQLVNDLEASGRMAVMLGAGDHLDLSLRQPANAVTVRYSVPDNSSGTLRVAGLALPLTAKYAWFYGGYPFTNNPADGKPRHRYDSVRALLPTAVQKVTLECVCTLDLADFELVAPALPQTGLSIVDEGADPTGAKDSSDAIEAALRKSRDVWIPPGTFKVTRHIVVANASIRGAGMWYSTLTGEGVGVYGHSDGHSGGVHLSDFAILGEVTERVDDAQLNGIGGAMGGGSTIERLFIQHTKVGMWFDGPFNSLTIRGCRIMDTTADGINLHRGISHAIVADTVVRNTGDDGLAMWSDQEPNHDNVFAHNTIQVPMLANGIGIYGGRDNLAEANVVADTVTEGAGIQLANRFSGTVPLDGTTTLRDNTVLRGGSKFPGVGDIGAVFLYGKDSPILGTIELDGDELLDSPYSGLHLFASRVANVRITGLLVKHPGTVGIQIQSAGAAKVADSKVEGGVNLCMDFTWEVTTSEGVSTPACRGI